MDSDQVRIGLLSDTHGYLDETLLGHFAACDEIWHAGDVGAPEILDRLQSLKPVRAVFGNIDGAEIRTRLAEDMVWSAGGLLVFMTHIGGYPGRYDPRARKVLAARKPGLFICGHSHIPRVMRDEAQGLLHLNPGACGHSGWHTQRTAMLFDLSDGRVSNLALIELGKRGAARS